jgi:hypothetical protein
MLLAFAAGLGALVLPAACGDDAPPPAPVGDCTPTDPACPALAVESECLALVDNSGKDEFALRMAQLTVTQPLALTEPLVQKFIGDGLIANLPACNLDGDGTFSLVTIFNRSTGRLTAGGALPESSPANGYCFVDDPANMVAPVEIGVDIADDGTFTTEPLPFIVLPVFTDLSGSSAVYLPLRQVVLTQATLSADQNCIGSYNATGLQPRFDCVPDAASGQPLFIDGGTLEGHITLEEADAVTVDVLNQSLCVVLSGDANTHGDGGDPIRCTRTGGTIDLQGDWCSATNSAGGCQDAFKLTATFSASAVELRTDCPAGQGGSGGTGGEGGAGGG